MFVRTPKDCIVQRNGRIAQPAGLHRVHHQLLPSRRSVQKLVGARGRRADACHAAVDLRSVNFAYGPDVSRPPSQWSHFLDLPPPLKQQNTLLSEAFR
eukprot:363042-Chlamydomonas_euryale.AAC.10